MAIKSFRAVAGSVSVVLDNGTLLFSKSVDKEDTEKLFTAASGIISLSDEEVVGIMNSSVKSSFSKEEKEVIAENKFVKEVAEKASNDELFERRGDAFYRKGVDLSVPKAVLRRYFDALDAKSGRDSLEFKSIDNFWLWCSLNPNKYAREELLGFLDAGGYMLTPNGYFVGYRGVRTKDETDKQLTDFITASYLRVRGAWKKKAANYIITDVSTGGFPNYRLEASITDAVPMGKTIGNLEELYQGITEGTYNTTYTDAHTGRMTIKLGQEVRIPRSQCDESSDNDCSRGLHLGNKHFGVESFGNTVIACLCNPMNVVAVPKYNNNKMRTCAYYPMGVAVREDGTLLELDYSQFEDAYYDEQVSQLLQMVKNNKPEELKLNNIASFQDLKGVLRNIENVGKIVKDRIVR